MHVPTFIADFFQTWVYWWNAEAPISTYILWGRPVFFWGRCGKVLELLGAFFLLYDILGREKSSTLASSFARTMTPKEMRTSLKSSWEAVREIYNDKQSYYILLVISLVIYALIFLALWWITGIYDHFVLIILFVCCLVGFIAIYLSLLLAGGRFARILAWLGAKEHRMRILNLVILATGIMFDLLAT